MTAASAVFSLRVHAKVCQWTSGDALAAREGQCRRLPLANRILQVMNLKKNRTGMRNSNSS